MGPLGQAKFDPANARQYPHTVARKSAIRQRPRSYSPGDRAGQQQEPPFDRITKQFSRSKRDRPDDWDKLLARQNEENAVAKGKRTFQPNNRRRARVHGFRLRMRTRAGRAIVSGRRRKGRRALSA